MSPRKQAASLLNLKKADAANASYLASLSVWSCAGCGALKAGTAHQRRQRFCSRECLAAEMRVSMRGAANPHFSNADARVCEQCGAGYRSYNKERKFCTHRCYTRSEGSMRGRLRKDNNHASIVEAIEKVGGIVIDMSRLGQGIPDVAVWTRKGWQVAEIKNPGNSYGRSGFNTRQKEWAGKQRAAVFIIRTVDDAIALVTGDLERLEGFRPHP